MTDDELAILRAIDALEDTVRATIELCATLTPAQWRRATACPGWTVHDQVAHLAGLESVLAGVPRPAHELPPLAHVVTDIDREIELDVELRRGRSDAAVLAELQSVSARHVAMLRADPPDPASRLPHLGGREVRALTAMLLRVADVWIHGEDIRRAIGEEPDDTAPAAELTTEYFLRSFDHVVERAAPPDGSVVRLEITEPFPFTRVVAMDAEPTDSPSVTLRMDVSTYTSLAAGRIPVATAPVEVSGDAALAAAVLADMIITP
jgi:uncharacterized protein (TIGR03083 family)